MPQGSLERSPAAAVSEPFSFSNPQKKSVLFGWPSLFTPMLPAKLRGSVQVTPGSESVTSKSVQESVTSGGQYRRGEKAYSPANPG